MRCPKCHYISFDSGDRCRNCGYEFALAADVKSLDLPIQTGDEAIGPYSDFNLSALEGSPTAAAPPAGDGLSDLPPAASAPVPQQRTAASSFDLPLFHDSSADTDAPLVAPPVAPRPPLSVRRASPVVNRTTARIQLEEPELDLEAPAAEHLPERQPVARRSGR